MGRFEVRDSILRQSCVPSFAHPVAHMRGRNDGGGDYDTLSFLVSAIVNVRME